MQVLVENGVAGCELAMERDAIAVVVDALRASANISSMIEFGTRRLIVVREVEQAFAEKDRWPEAILSGERGGPRVDGFDRGNSPLQGPPASPFTEVIFSSSNCSRCCVGVADAPCAFIASTVNARAAGEAIVRAAEATDTEAIVLVTAGSAANEARLTIEDHLAAGAIMAEIETAGGHLQIGNDRARVCRMLYKDGDQEHLTLAFRQSTNGRALTELGLGRDVEFCSRLDVFDAVPCIARSVELAAGGRGALILPECPRDNAEQ